ncbi:carbohydrate ABC transporter permease [Paenibacillus sp. GCM10027626]|uniref:carbohydrate ABC transporter permease n=1 Tax=Paenibacillus sp. GCM10027626 TaxID=3273411 RepID=UPI003630CAD4
MVERKAISWFNILNVAIMLSIVVVTLFPFLYMINVSLSSPEYIIRGEVALWPKGFTLDMYQKVFEDSRIWIGYKNTILYTCLGTFFSLMITAMGGYALSRKGLWLGRFFMYMIVFTMLFSGGMIPTFLVVKQLGLMDTIWAMVVPGLVSVWNLIIMRTFFQGLPGEIIESGKIDGLNDIGIFVRLVLPLSKAVLATIALFYAVGIWNNFFTAFLYLREASMFPLQVALRNLVLGGQMNESFAGSDADVVVLESLKFAAIIVSTLPILLTYPFIQKYFVKGVMIGSVKG